MSYADLHFDAKTAIARTSISAWNALMRADPHFGRYALSDAGRSAFLTMFTTVNNNEYRIGGRLHRIDGPARASFGSEEWYYRNRLHRVDGPAVTYAVGGEMWYVNNQLHRVDGPARVFANGSEEWYEYGKRHRVGGPACTYTHYTEYWERGICVQSRTLR